MRSIKPLLTALLLTALLVAVFMGGMLSPAAWADVGAPQPGTVLRAASYTHQAATAGVTGTTYTDAPNTTAGGLDVSYVADWHAADVFVTADVGDGGSLVVTPQFSADQSNWADANYAYVMSGTVATETYQATVAADGTTLIRLPVAGEYMRFKLARTGPVTVTVQATLRNN